MVGLILFAATILLLRDFRVLERYRYTIALVGLLLLLLPRVPGIGQQVNGAYLGVKLGPIAFQPAEFGKIAIVIFLAAYLRDTRQVLVQGRDASGPSRSRRSSTSGRCSWSGARRCSCSSSSATSARR